MNRPGAEISTLGQLVAEFASADEDWIGAAFHPTEPRLYAEVDTDLIGIFTLDPEKLIEIARSRFKRPLLRQLRSWTEDPVPSSG